jgi:radical SAM superfamily enzyme YgiQ (UPF0313 family)
MNILLVYPSVPDTFWSFKHALKLINKKASFPPIGILTVAALLPEEWDKKLVDMNVTNLTDKDFDWADMVFIGGMTVQEKSARNVIEKCREKGLKTVCGGPLFTIEHEKFPDVDYLVLDEAELTLPQFLEDLKNGCAKRIYRASGYANIKKSPTPLWELADLKKYASTNVQFSRGCPFQCDFCNVTSLFGHKFRTKSVSQVITELDKLNELGNCHNVFFVDDNLIGNKHKLKKELLPALIEWRKRVPGVTFLTEVSIDIADDDELLQMMVDAGFTTVFIGVETPDDECLMECNKKQNEHRDLLADIRKIHRAGLQVLGGFIVGFDSDKPTIFQRQIEFIQKSGIVTAMVGLLQAPPGTKLYERLKGEGRLRGDEFGDNVDGTTNIIPKMNFQTLHDGYKRILKQIYSPRMYYKRVKVFLLEYKRPKMKTRLKPKFVDIFIIIKIVFLLGLIDQGRLYYWKIILWTMVRRPRLLPLALTLMVYGHHYRIVTQLHIT